MRLVHIFITGPTKTVVMHILRKFIALVLRWPIAFLRWAIIVLSIGILGRTVAAIVVLRWSVGIANSVVTSCIHILTPSAWRTGRTLAR